MKIFVADDSRTSLTMISNSLKKLGHDVIAFASGEQLIDTFKNERPDLVILDVIMNGMTGFETAKKLREMESKIWIPIIFLSSNLDDESIKQGIDSGGDDYLTKPCSEITLAAKIKAMQRISDNNKKLEALETAKTEFISIVSHELRTPITAIHGSLSLVLSQKLSSENTMEMISVAARNCERLLRLLNDILDVQKLESGKMTYDFKEFDLHRILDEAIKINQGYAEKFNVQLVFNQIASGIKVNVDYDRIIQVLTNLISNAIKFSPVGSQVTLGFEKLDEKLVRISVIDQGAGIPNIFHDKIFGKFKQAIGSSNKSQGTGLGLNISKSIIEAHEGDIGFISKENAGTTFYFDLPMQ